MRRGSGRAHLSLIEAKVAGPMPAAWIVTPKIKAQSPPSQPQEEGTADTWEVVRPLGVLRP